MGTRKFNQKRTLTRPHARQGPQAMASSPIKVQTFLANVPLFREIAAEELDRIAVQTKVLRFDRGQILFQRGETCDGFYVIVYGQVKLAFISTEGAEKVVDLLGPGQSFGEAVMFMERPHVVTAQALADTLVIHVGKQTVFDEIDRDSRFARRMIGGLSQRLHYFMNDLEGYAMHSGTQRVIGYLLRDAPGGRSAGVPVEITLPTTKGIIASRLNLTQEHFSRILHELVAAGLIQVRGRRIAIPDVRRLLNYNS